MESIGGILARSQQGHSATSRQIEKTCPCGETFTATIWTRPDGSETAPATKCRKCDGIERHEKLKLEAEIQLKKVSSEQDGVWFKDSKMPGKFWEKTFGNFDGKLQPKALESTKNLRWEWSNDSPPKSLLLLSPGVYGIGKTHLVCALMNHIIETENKATMDKNLFIEKLPCPVYFNSENELLRRIRNTYNRSRDSDGIEETEEAIYRQLSRIKLLIIDDVGKVKPRDLNFLQGVYFNIIDQRYNDSQPIILTTNLSLVELEEHVGGASADRLREMCGKNGIIKMSGESYRRK